MAERKLKDLDNRLIEIFIDSFSKILIPGLTVTIPLTVISFSLALIIATAVALLQFADIRGFKQAARLYIWVIRGTPLLVQLFVVFFGLPSLGSLRSSQKNTSARIYQRQSNSLAAISVTEPYTLREY